MILSQNLPTNITKNEDKSFETTGSLIWHTIGTKVNCHEQGQFTTGQKVELSINRINHCLSSRNKQNQDLPSKD